MHRVIYFSHSLPIAISILFCSNDDVHTHHTRFKHQFHLNYVGYSNSLSFNGPSMWIKLPNNIKECQSLSAFVRLGKSFLFREI